MRQEHERRRQAAFGFVEVMLRDPGRIEAASLGLHDLRGGQSIPLCGARLVEQAREEPQTLRHAAKLARTDHSCKAKHISCVLHGADWYNLCIVPSVPSVSRWEDVLFACAFLMRTFSIQDGVRLPLSAPSPKRAPVSSGCREVVMPVLHRRFLLGASAALLLGRAAQAEPAKGEPITMGVSGPLTGPNAQYGAQWKQGFDLALDEIQAAGGINGRKLAYTFQDSQSDPRQSVAIAQKFVSDPKIVMELGDFSSPASMAASPIYQRGGLVQFGFTNSHPDFTKGGDFMWSTSVSQADEQPLLARYAVRHLGLKKLAVLHQNTDWGRTSKDYFVKAAKDYGADVAVTEGYIADERDFRSTLVRVRDTNPDGLILIS